MVIEMFEIMDTNFTDLKAWEEYEADMNEIKNITPTDSEMELMAKWYEINW